MTNPFPAMPEVASGFLWLAAQLSPENLDCDGEISLKEKERKEKALNLCWTALEQEKAFRQVTGQEVDGWQETEYQYLAGLNAIYDALTTLGRKKPGLSTAIAAAKGIVGTHQNIARLMEKDKPQPPKQEQPKKLAWHREREGVYTYGTWTVMRLSENWVASHTTQPPHYTDTMRKARAHAEQQSQ